MYNPDTMRRIRLPRIYGPLVLVLGAVVVNPAYASLVFDGVATGQGAGIGSSNTILTIQNTPFETGCVGWNGSADVIGAAACQGGLSPSIPGGNEKTGSSQTQTQTVASTGLLNGQGLVVILNVGEPAGNLFTIENLSLSLYSPTGAVLFNTGNLFGAGVPPGGGITLDSSLQGQGNLGFAFVLNSVQAAAISPFICTNAAVSGCSGIANILNATNRIGLSALLINVAGGNETFSVADRSSVAATIPEPVTSLTVCAGLIILGMIRRVRSSGKPAHRANG